MARIHKKLQKTPKNANNELTIHKPTPHYVSLQDITHKKRLFRNATLKINSINPFSGTE